MGFILIILVITIFVFLGKLSDKNTEIDNLQKQIKKLSETNQQLENSSANALKLLQPLAKTPQLFMDKLYHRCLQHLTEQNFSFLNSKEEHIQLWKTLQAPQLPPTFSQYVHQYKTTFYQEHAIQKIDKYLKENPTYTRTDGLTSRRLDELIIHEFQTIYELYFQFYCHLLDKYQKVYDLHLDNLKQVKITAKRQQELGKKFAELLSYARKKEVQADNLLSKNMEKISDLWQQYDQEKALQSEKLQKERDLLKNQKEELDINLLNLQKEKKKFEKEKDSDLASCLSLYKAVPDITLEKAANSYGELSSILETDRLNAFTDFFISKTHPSIKSHHIVSTLRKEQKQKIRELRKYEYIIKAYENMFPWLVEFKEYPLESSLKANSNEENDEEIFVHYLSPSERKKLTKSEKFQRVLDRYEDSYDKTNWQIGLFYERYIGYTYDIKQWKVIMNGARKRWQDMGIDIIASKSGKTELIQCKYWAANKTIYENYIFQLFGTTIDYIMEHFSTEDPWDILRKRIVVPVFITSTQVSNTARRVAQILKIDLRENIKLDKKYPKIKCNPDSPDGKIFHLPFDQQYDNFQIGNNPNAFYIKTVAEAEKLGFRRAYRWHPVD